MLVITAKKEKNKSRNGDMCVCRSGHDIKILINPAEKFPQTRSFLLKPKRFSTNGSGTTIN